MLLWQLNLGEQGESPPNDLDAVLGIGVVDLTWTDTVTDNTGYAVERSTSGGAFVEIEADIGDVETYQDNTIAPDTSYDYRLRVLGGELDGEFSNTAGIGFGAYEAILEAPFVLIF